MKMRSSKRKHRIGGIGNDCSLLSIEHSGFINLIFVAYNFNFNFFSPFLIETLTSHNHVYANWLNNVCI